MARVRTDDDIYRARLLYLGPPGYTLPIHLSYAQWFVGAALAAAFGGAAYLVIGNPWLTWWATCASGLATALIFKYVNPDRHAWHVIRTALTDWRRTKPQPTGQMPSYSVAHIRIGRGQ
ncbi:MAG TPA: hypothetical protein VK453_25605 [Micromonosporaceae bacterium]|nr:hypothetical protein [Micromonosporaceae bacterium]